MRFHRGELFVYLNLTTHDPPSSRQEKRGRDGCRRQRRARDSRKERFSSFARSGGFFFVGIGPVRGTSFPFELSVGGFGSTARQFFLSCARLLPTEPEPTMDRWSTAQRNLVRRRETRGARGSGEGAKFIMFRQSCPNNESNKQRVIKKQMIKNETDNQGE